MIIVFSKLRYLVESRRNGGSMIVPNALIRVTLSGGRIVRQGSPNTSTVSLCNANFSELG